MTIPVVRIRRTLHAIVAFVALLFALTARPASAQSPSEGKYVVTVGTPADRLASGTLWLYSYSWYGLQRFKLADIANGLAAVPLDTERLKREANPHPSTSAYVLVIRAGENLWFRTPDLPTESFWTDFPQAIRSLGTATVVSTGETQLVLPAPVRRRITLLDPAGRAKANHDVALSIYLWDQNHCGVHEGLPLGRFRTDAKGSIEVLAPKVPLYFDGLQYYPSKGTGPAGTLYSSNMGMKISAEETVSIKAAWEIPHFTAQLQVLTSAGRPRPGVDVWGNWNTNTCGGGDRIARTDASGMVTLNLDATFNALTLIIGGPYTAADPEAGKNTRSLSDAELRELFSRRKVTIRW